MLSQDLLSRIVNVNWPGGLIMMLWVGGFKNASGPAAPAPSLDITIDSNLGWLGWHNKGLADTDLAEKLRGVGLPVLFDTEPFKREMFALTEETDEETTTSSFTVKDIVRYGVINQHTGESIGVCVNPFLGYSIPFTFVFGGASPGFQDGDYPTFQAPPADPFTMSEAAATDCGLSGVGWKPLEQLVLASHEDTGSFTAKAWQQNRLIAINLSKLLGDNPDLETFHIDVHAGFVGGDAEQSFGLFANLGIYKKTEQDPVVSPPDPGGWPLVSGVPIQVGGSLESSNGSQAYFPPGSGPDRDPVNDNAFVAEALASGEGISPPGKIRFTVNLSGDEPVLTADVILDFE
jgi:hypothetical protein